MKIDVVAKRYAFAFFNEVKGSESITTLGDLANLIKTSPDFAAVIKSPVIGQDEKLAVFQSLKDTGKLTQSLFNFISLLIDKKRLFLLPKINDEVVKLAMEQNGEVLAEVTFAKDVDDKVSDDLKAQLSKLIGKKIVLNKVINSNVIGGVKVQIGSTLYDATVKGQLDKMKIILQS